MVGTGRGSAATDSRQQLQSSSVRFTNSNKTGPLNLAAPNETPPPADLKKERLATQVRRIRALVSALADKASQLEPSRAAEDLMWLAQVTEAAVDEHVADFESGPVALPIQS